MRLRAEALILRDRREVMGKGPGRRAARRHRAVVRRTDVSNYRGPRV